MKKLFQEVVGKNSLVFCSYIIHDNITDNQLFMTIKTENKTNSIFLNFMPIKFKV